jgi:hypothetical protein
VCHEDGLTISALKISLAASYRQASLTISKRFLPNAGDRYLQPEFLALFGKRNTAGSKTLLFISQGSVVC